MKVIPQYKVIGPYNYGRIIRSIEKNYARRQDLADAVFDAWCGTVGF